MLHRHKEKTFQRWNAAALQRFNALYNNMKKLILLSILTSLIIPIASAQNISDIQATFCNKPIAESNLDIITKANQETDICVNFKNNSITKSNISIDFVDWTITPQWSKACFSAEKPRLNFGQHMLDYEKELTLNPSQEIQKIYKIKFPVWFSGVSHGCLAYNINKTDDISGGIGLVFRKTHTIDILVWWTKIDSKINIKDVTINKTNNTDRLNLNITNNWNIDQQIIISWTISNILWYNQIFIITWQTIKAQEDIILSTEINNLPWYKGLFSVNTQISYTPIFNFDITNHNIPNEYITPWVINISKNIILRNMYYIITILIILLLLWIIVNKYIRRGVGARWEK